MSKNNIIKKLKKLKSEFIVDGIEIVGIFGSYARNEQNEFSDLDIVYSLNENQFFKKYQGFKSVSKLASVKEKLTLELDAKVDFISLKNSNSDLVQNIKKDLIYV